MTKITGYQYKAIAARVYRTSDFNLTNGGTPMIPFTTESYDTSNMWDAANPTRLVAPVTGYYRIAGGVRFGNNANGERIVNFYFNGTSNIATQQHSVVSGSYWAWLQLSGEYYFTAGQYVEMSAYQNSGGNLAALSGVGSLWFSMSLIGVA